MYMNVAARLKTPSQESSNKIQTPPERKRRGKKITTLEQSRERVEVREEDGAAEISQTRTFSHAS